MIDFPASPTVGQKFTTAGVTWMWDGVKWTLSPAVDGASITVSDTPPPSPTQGALWWDSVHGQMYLFYDDGSSQQWVPTTNQMGGNYLPLSGGSLSGPLTPSGIVGVSNGSDALAGQIGEVISNVRVVASALTLTTGVVVNVCTITLTPGDWDVQGNIWYSVGAGGGSNIQCGISNVSATIPADASISQTRMTDNIPGMGAGQMRSLGACRASVATATTYYLYGSLTFVSGTSTVYGAMWARRMR